MGPRSLIRWRPGPLGLGPLRSARGHSSGLVRPLRREIGVIHLLACRPRGRRRGRARAGPASRGSRVRKNPPVIVERALQFRARAAGGASEEDDWCGGVRPFAYRFDLVRPSWRRPPGAEPFRSGRPSADQLAGGASMTAWPLAVRYRRYPHDHAHKFVSALGAPCSSFKWESSRWRQGARN